MFSLRKVFMKPAAVLLSAVMLVGGSFVSGSYDHTGAESNSITYIKHYYNSTKADERYSIDLVDIYTNVPCAVNDVFPSDPRPNAAPNTSMVYLEDWTPASQGYINGGSAFIVDKHTIITARHAVYSNGNFPTDLRMYIAKLNPASNDDLISLTPTAIHVPITPIGESDSNYDYAIVTVEENLKSYGYFSLGLASQDAPSYNVPVHNLGFLFPTVTGTPPILKKSDSHLNSWKDGFICTDNYIIGGTSGGPLYTECKINGKSFITAIGIAGAVNPSDPENRSIFVPINSNILKFAFDNEYL